MPVFVQNFRVVKFLFAPFPWEEIEPPKIMNEKEEDRDDTVLNAGESLSKSKIQKLGCNCAQEIR